MSRPVVTDASDEAQVRAAERYEEDTILDIDYLLKEPRGRRWLWTLIFETCHVHSLSYVPGDQMSTAFNEGGKSVGLALLSQITAHYPARYKKMIEENGND